MTCIAIMGWPRTGKTTYATALAQRTGLPLISTGKRSEALDIYTKFFIDLEWEEVPHVVRRELKKYPGWILEGTQSARVIRKWYEEEPETLHLTRVHYFDNPPWVPRTPEATAMGEGVATIFGRGKPSRRKPVLSYLRQLNVEVVYGPDDSN
jgi:hypothetical protein